MKKLFVIQALLFCLAFLGAVTVFADEVESPTPASPSVSEEVSSKLREVLETQQQILKELEEIKSEMKVLKVRISQNQ